MGKGQKKGDAAAAAPLPRAATSGSWFPSRRRRQKVCKWLLWLVVPLLLAAAVAYAAPPPPPESKSERRKPGTAAKADAAAENSLDEGDASDPSTHGGKPPPIDTHPNASECAAWAGSGQCKANPGFMLVSCAFSCAKLEYAKERYNKRCPRPDDYTAALPPGQMHATFDRIMRDFPELEPERISEDPPVTRAQKPCLEPGHGTRNCPPLTDCMPRATLRSSCFTSSSARARPMPSSATARGGTRNPSAWA
jgi:hypothetical protein